MSAGARPAAATPTAARGSTAGPAAEEDVDDALEAVTRGARSKTLIERMEEQEDETEDDDSAGEGGRAGRGRSQGRSVSGKVRRRERPRKTYPLVAPETGPSALKRRKVRTTRGLASQEELKLPDGWQPPDGELAQFAKTAEAMPISRAGLGSAASRGPQFKFGRTAEHNWNMWYRVYKEFMEANPEMKNVVPSDGPGFLAYGRLQTWANNQRARFRTGNLSKERIAKLEEVGFSLAELKKPKPSEGGAKDSGDKEDTEPQVDGGSAEGNGKHEDGANSKDVDAEVETQAAMKVDKGASVATLEPHGGAPPNKAVDTES
eukprot:CAMPEP_0198328468 /NCGR_PEP_ID=MMETSP1450-20131203/15507_1 /TAXON_ID=753684 ORGANISM="Madagascaria erythrocladiodes, Strain CCMP3234" /NCGR_SAMPLE_ID=MMETSP1450 /ASSEMBLY_ACC=CAM_ASM_001115 /LENGTH=318 /DNA_ID=CAMNT_0044032607 /DNA_START=99 /DNA_END=1055 /DNA_ORIENTATION=+